MNFLLVLCSGACVRLCSNHLLDKDVLDALAVGDKSPNLPKATTIGEKAEAAANGVEKLKSAKDAYESSSLPQNLNSLRKISVGDTVNNGGASLPPGMNQVYGTGGAFSSVTNSWKRTSDGREVLTNSDTTQKKK